MTRAQEFHLRTPRIVLSNQRTSPRYLANQESPRDAIGHGNREGRTPKLKNLGWGQHIATSKYKEEQADSNV